MCVFVCVVVVVVCVCVGVWVGVGRRSKFFRKVYESLAKCSSFVFVHFFPDRVRLLCAIFE